MVDPFGNEIRFSYFKADNNIYPQTVNYVVDGDTSLYRIKYEFENRSVWSSTHISQFPVKNAKLLDQIVVQTSVSGSWETIRNYDLTYDNKS
jgi:hypothetical protein